MGKKQVKTKGRNPKKAVRRAPPPPPPPATPAPMVKGDDGQRCKHCLKDKAEIDRILSKILSPSSAVPACEFCRGEPINKRGNKQQVKRKANSSSGSDLIWVCIDCGRDFCGGDVSVSEPYGHARRHAKQEKHAWAVKFGDPLVCWCFTCNSTVNIELPELATTSGEQQVGVAMDLGDNLGGILDRGSVVRGLVNLGNTCFMNSVLQNLFVVDKLRDYFAKLDRPVGPVTMALKKLFAETSSGADLEGILSPKSIFGCICAKAPQFRGYQQQDSHEFLSHLFDALHCEEVSARKSDEIRGKVNSTSPLTFVDEIFGGQLCSSVCCMECSYISIVREPFLDLSLPIPSKKAQPRKAEVEPTTKNKQLARDRNESRKFHGKEVSKELSVAENQKLEMESNAGEIRKGENLSLLSISPEEQNVVTDAGDSFSWLDYLEPATADDSSAEPISIDSEAIVGESSINTVDNENDALQSAAEVPENTCFVGPMLPPDFYGEGNIGDEASSSAFQDSGVILLPYKELDSTVEGISKMTVCSQDSEASQSVTHAPAQPQQGEDDFCGFGDLFNEPEVVSVANKDSNANEDINMGFRDSNINEYNQDEIDDSSSPVSINNCLALFTKPELLSNEHAWYCERCSAVDKNAVGNIKDAVKSSIGNAESAEHEGSYNGTISAISNLIHINDVAPKNEAKEELEDDESTIRTEHNEKLIADENHSWDEENGSHFNGLPSDVLVNEPTRTSNGSDDMPTVCPNNRSVQGKGKNHLESNGRVHGIEKNIKDSEASRVKVKRDATKRILINKAPPVLIVHLKRFSQDIRGRFSKLSGHVDFQENLDLRPYMDPRFEKDSCIYRLLGVVEHCGTMRGGHYIAYIRGTAKKDGDPRWFYASDAHIRETSLAEVLRSEAYILFYERVNF